MVVASGIAFLANTIPLNMREGEKEGILYPSLIYTSLHHLDLLSRREEGADVGVQNQRCLN